MSIFSTILAKIFPQDHPAVTGSSETTQVTPPATSVGTAPAAAAPAAPSPAVAMPEVDVEQQLVTMAATQSQTLNWRTSIVDLMKLLGIDSSLSSRQALAKELHYTGDMNDSATMNVWLHKQVMVELEANGGKVPASLRG